MKRKLLLICILLTFSQGLSANGGGIHYFGVNRAGNPHFKDFPEVKILREDLLIRPTGDRIDIRVTYLMYNTSAKDIKGLHYAFPVDFWCQRNFGLVNDIYTELPLNPEKEMAQAIKYVEFTCNGEELSSQSQTPQDNDNQNYEWSVPLRAWYFTEIDLPRGISQLIVTYSIASQWSWEMESTSKFAMFSYDFSPAGTFGDGKIKEFAITIDASDLVNSEIDFKLIDRGINVDGCPYSFDKQGEIYTHTQSDFDLKQAKLLHFGFDHENKEAQILIDQIPANDLIIKTSSTSSQYPLSNLTDLDFGSAFVFGNNGGVGEWIEITAKDKILISSVYLLPGYYKSEEAYRNNNRIKKVLVEYLSRDGEVMDSYSEEQKFPDNGYQKPDYTNFSASLQYPFGICYDYFDPIDPTGKPIDEWMPATVRITILELYQGEKFNDTCISEIFVTRGRTEIDAETDTNSEN